MQISRLPAPQIRISSLACRLLLWVDNVTRVVVKNNSLLASQTPIPILRYPFQTPAPKCDSNSYSFGSLSCSLGPKSPDRQPCRQFLLSWLQNLYYFKQFVIVLPALRRKMTPLAESFTSVDNAGFIYLVAILWVILQVAHVFLLVGSYFVIVNDFLEGIWLKLRFELFSLPIFHLISYTLYKESWEILKSPTIVLDCNDCCRNTNVKLTF